MAVIGFIDQFVTVIAEQSSLWTFHIARSAMMLAMVAAWLAVARRRFGMRRPRAVAAYAAVRSFALMLYFAALGTLSVAQAAAGLFTAPIWVMLLSVILFRLPVGPVRIGAAVAGFAGVLLVLSPDPRTIEPMIVAALAAGGFYALSAIATREWCAGEATTTLASAQFVAMALWSAGGLIVVAILGAGDDFLTRGWVWPDGTTWFWIAVQAVGSLAAVVLLTYAYQVAEASVASVFEYSVLGFSAFFGWIVWGQGIGVWGVAGLALIAASGAVIALRGRA